MANLRTGIDLVDISRLETLNPAIRRRFLQRVFTPAEIAEVAGPAEVYNRWDTLAGRFAAKEAVVKALGCGIGPIAWQEVEILRGQQGEPLLKLYGEAQRMAAEMGLSSWSISISHTRTQAVALAVATGSDMF